MKDRTGRAHRRLAALAAVLLVGVVGCTSVLDRPTLPSAGTAVPRTGTAQTTTAASITPVTPDGLVTGPGVTDGVIALGVLADPARDRGFTDGVRLWQRSVNTTGGLCGRTIDLRTNGADGVPVDPAAAYRAIGTSVLGLLTLPVGSPVGVTTSRTTPSSATTAGPAATGETTAGPAATGATTAGGATGSTTADSAGATTAAGTGDADADTDADADAILAASMAADQIPAVAPTGTSGQLGPTRPIVAGATADILAINGLQYLLSAGTLRPGDVVGVLSDGSATAQNALAGAQWWARRNGLELDLRDPGTAPGTWPASGVVLAPVGAPTVSALIAGRPGLSVLTLLDGFDPGSWTAETVAAAAGRLSIATPAPAYGSDDPAAVAVSSLAAAVGSTDSGARTLDGYAVGSTWGRLIDQACADRSLTRTGVGDAATTVGPAPTASLFGPSDPGLVVQSALPATRVSSVSVADAAAPTGLRPVSVAESAPGIDDYRP